MNKPTPGPMRIDEGVDEDRGAFVFDQHDRIVAEFYEGEGVPHEEMVANARAWVEARDAVETLEKIRHVIKYAPLLQHERLQAIDKLLDEPATGGKEST